MHYKLPGFTAVFLALSASIAVCQTAGTYAAALPSPASSLAEARPLGKEISAKLRAMLDETQQDAESLASLENRIKLKIDAADLLWSLDPGLARRLFEEAAAELARTVAEGSVADGTALGSEPDVVLEGVLQRLLVLKLSRHDPRFARGVLQKLGSRLQSSRAPGQSSGAEREALPIELAQKIADSDPALAGEIAEDALATGLTSGVAAVVESLAQNDRESAIKLAQAVLSKLKTLALQNDEIAQDVAMRLLVLALSSSSDAVERDEGDLTRRQSQKKPLLNSEDIGYLAEELIAGALSAKEGNRIRSQLSELVSDIEKYAPSRTAEFRRTAPPRKAVPEASASRATSAGKASSADNRYGDLVRSGSVDDILNVAKSAPESARESLVLAAAQKAIGQGEYERARRIADGALASGITPDRTRGELDRAILLHAIQSGRLEIAEENTAKMPISEERALALLDIATRQLERGDMAEAKRLLDLADEQIGFRAGTVQQLSAQFRIARAFAQVDPAKGISILENVVDRLNEIIAAGFVMAQFALTDFLANNELRVAVSGDALADSLRDASGDLRTLAVDDFDRMRRVADRFQRIEVRLAARLVLARALLAYDQAGPPVGASR